jgi:hypothetical protein
MLVVVVGCADGCAGTYCLVNIRLILLSYDEKQIDGTVDNTGSRAASLSMENSLTEGSLLE